MALIAKLYDNGRSAERHMLDADATVRGPDQVPVDVLVADLSLTGCLFLSSESLAVGSVITIGIAGIGRRDACIVRVEEPRYGCSFLPPLTDDELTAGLTESETISPFPDWLRQPAGETIPETVTPKYSRRARLVALVGLTAAAWLLFIIALSRLGAA
jgi:hypothetical protein